MRNCIKVLVPGFPQVLQGAPTLIFPTRGGTVRGFAGATVEGMHSPQAPSRACRKVSLSKGGALSPQNIDILAKLCYAFPMTSFRNRWPARRDARRVGLPTAAAEGRAVSETRYTITVFLRRVGSIRDFSIAFTECLCRGARDFPLGRRVPILSTWACEAEEGTP
jgi:hypothetical protein